MIKYSDLFEKNIAFWGDGVQNILKKSSVLIAGCGGLGSVVSSNLVRSGIGKLILLDYDVVEVSNLNRQILFDMQDISLSKTTVTKTKLEKINPFCEIEIINKKLTDNTDLSLFQFDGIVDCLDNYESRFVLEKNLKENSFLVHGGISADFGQITTIIPDKTKTLYDIFQGADSQPNKAISPLIVNIIGTMMSWETINNLIGKPQLLNRILVFEMTDLSMNFIELES